MCYMNCPYEDHEGECTDSSKMGAEDSGCADCFPDEMPDEDNALES